RHGFVIGGMADVRYRSYSLVLEPGAKLFVYTDGVPEATDPAGTLFGTGRMLEALRASQEDSSEGILRSVHAAVKDFSGTAPQFDDITMLCLQYFGPDSEEGRNVRELTVEASAKNIETITDFVNAELEAIGCPAKAQMQIDVAIDEVVANVSAYAYGTGIGEVTVRFEALEEPRAVELSFIDGGMPFDPLTKEDPDVALAAEDRPVGGLGIFLVKKTMDAVAYEYKDGKNILRIRKNL
ncbi:MAG: ATP-binding protein, partial [Oscillospiraceae bacterium]|nr:ATP-binding protein [Oscillospiraceae bacterium]